MCLRREHVQRPGAGRDRRARASREIEQAHDLGPAPRIDVDDQRGDVREHEVEPEAGARVIGVRAAVLVAGPADVVDHVALAQGAEAIVDGDRELLIDIARTFNDEVPALLANVRQSASARDARGLERAAHALKSACSNFSAAAAVDAMSVLEQAGRSQKFEQIDECLDRAERELERLRRALVALCDSRQESAA